jgi:hypothetical protein
MSATVKWLLWLQLALTIASFAVAGVSLLGGQPRVSSRSGRVVVTGVLVSSSVVVYGVLLLAGGVIGLVAVRRRSSVWYLRASIVLLAPAVLGIASSFTTSSVDESVPDDVLPSGTWQDMLRLLTWSTTLAAAAAVVAVLSAVLVLLLRRKAGEPELGVTS